MAKITDSQGKQWGLMASKDAMGRIYVRAYQNKWDVQKSRSYVAAKVLTPSQFSVHTSETRLADTW